MKILAIRGNNLASLAGSFEVDFQQEPLASAGLFAISGPTGAGKSTLLDALCLALYDATPRLINAGSRGIALPDVRGEKITPHDTRNLLRRGCAEAHAEVDFIGNDGLAYRARWSVRRSRSKADGALQKLDMTLCTLADLQPIGGTKNEVKAEIEQRIGLSFEQFTRAVLLAQNEFSTFLKADDNERGELLETLTGSAIYSAISRRAYEREKLESAALQVLKERLADQRPLEPELRARLDADSSQASKHVEQLEQRKILLEQDLRWHQDWGRFQAREQQAQLDWDERRAGQLAAAARQADLAQIEAVQDARPLLHEQDRLAVDIGVLAGAITNNESELAAARALKESTDRAVSDAALALQTAEQARRAAALQLDEAKAQDARIATLAPRHAQAEQMRAEAQRAAETAGQALAAKEAERNKASGQQQENQAWLAQNQQLQTLAEGWPRWDTLLRQAAQTQQGGVRIASALAAARRHEALQQEHGAAADSAVLASTAALQAAQIQRDQASSRLAAFAPEALQGRKQSAELRRDLLAGAAQIWRTLAEQQERRQQQSDTFNQLQQAIGQSEQALKQARDAQAGLEAALAQAERSQKSAEAACGETVESLRATLEDGEHCPVCGAREHPYHAANPQLHATLQSLQAEVAGCRQQVQDNLTRQAAHNATLDGSRTQLAGAADELSRLAQAIQLASVQWDTHALVAGADMEADGVTRIAAAERPAWFAEQQKQLQVELDDISAQERAWLLAGEAKERAQTELDACAVKHAAARDAVGTAKLQIAQASAERSALEEQLRAATQQIALQLDALAEALDGGSFAPAATKGGWQQAWRAEPEAFHALRHAEARSWLTRKQAHGDTAIRIGTLEVECKALQEAQAKAQAEATRAMTEFSASESTLNAMQAERRRLFDGKPLKQVEAEFESAIADAKLRLNQQTEAAKAHAANETRCNEVLAQTRLRLATETQAAQTAQQKLNDWLAQFNARPASQVQDAQPGQQGATAAPLDADQLRALLAQSTEWISKERIALQALASAVDNAASIFRERQAQRQHHEQLRPRAAEAGFTSVQTNAAEGVAALQIVLTGLAAERQTANEAMATHQLAIAQDDVRRTQSSSMLLQIEQQQSIQHRWAKMAELIGSADGKKFRNYAQQYTLDVLLAYANRHLHDLSRRYRLERIKESLALMVLDQDMGDELRSVHSLSGGESFLVSLALALGLASLSSNRVRVESLFIDEGFGSLDADTLRVAMDALDGLQAMGRKVGVISHVQEMTERIGAKIMVQRTAGGRSRVSIG